MTQPYSAGALMSTVDDLALWEAAVSSRKLLSGTSWERAFGGFTLAGGEQTHYGFGWQLDEYEGRKLIHHGGGIPGYASEALRMPQERLYVAILTNSDDAPVDLGFLATRLAAEVIGQPYREPARIELPDALLDTYVGVYRIDENSTRTITREGRRLFMQRTGAPRFEILATAELEFFRPNSFQRLSFVKDLSGHVVEFGFEDVEPSGGCTPDWTDHATAAPTRGDFE
jgi:CubicO group peptidase (beta-lactamase class C family)